MAFVLCSESVRGSSRFNREVQLGGTKIALANVAQLLCH